VRDPGVIDVKRGDRACSVCTQRHHASERWLDGKLARLSGPIITEAVAHHDPMFAELHRLNGVCWIQRCWGLLSERHARTDTPGQPTMPSVPGGSSAGRRPQGRDVF